MEGIDGGLHPAVDGQSIDEMMRWKATHYIQSGDHNYTNSTQTVPKTSLKNMLLRCIS